MKDTYNIIPDASVEILRQLKGQMVEGISVEQTETLEHTLSQMVILHLSNEDISIWSNEVKNRQNEYPDLAQVCVFREQKGRWDSLGERLARFPLGATVDSVEVITDTVTIHEKNQAPFSLVNTKGIAMRLGSKTLWLEKGCYWSEVLEVTLTPNPEAYAFRNEWSSPADDDDTIYQSKTEHQMI